MEHRQASTPCKQRQPNRCYCSSQSCARVCAGGVWNWWGGGWLKVRALPPSKQASPASPIVGHASLVQLLVPALSRPPVLQISAQAQQAVQLSPDASHADLLAPALMSDTQPKVESNCSMTCCAESMVCCLLSQKRHGIALQQTIVLAQMLLQRTVQLSVWQHGLHDVQNSAECTHSLNQHASCLPQCVIMICTHSAHASHKVDWSACRACSLTSCSTCCPRPA